MLEDIEAAEIKEEVSDEVKHDRFNRLLEVQNRITLEENLLLVGTEKTVMVEGTSKTDSSVLTGRTEANQIVNFKASGGQPGSFAKVYINDAKTWHLEGELINWK